MNQTISAVIDLTEFTEVQLIQLISEATVALHPEANIVDGELECARCHERGLPSPSGVTCNPAIEGHLVSGQRKPPKEASIGPLGLGAKLVAYFFPIALVFVGVTDSHRAPEQLPDLRAYGSDTRPS